MPYVELSPSTGSTVTPAALTKTDDTNVTLTLGGTPATALLQASSITAGWTGTLSTTRGGLGANNGAATGIPVFASGTATVTATATVIGNMAVRYDAAQSLTANQQAQARANIDVTQKNYVLNGGMQISQENGSTAGTTARYYPVDMFFMNFSNSGTQTAMKVPGSPGGGNRIRITATTADAAVAAGDYCIINQVIEDLRVLDLALGYSVAKTITLQFGVKAPAGTYCVALTNYAGNRCYVSEYVIAAGEANTDVVKSVTVVLDKTGSWDHLVVTWALMCGTTYQQAANSWGTVPYAMASANQFNFMGVAGRIFELFDVSLTEGNVAPPFVAPDYASELAVCQRYYSVIYGPMVFTGWCDVGLTFYTTYTLPVVMRAVPTCGYVGVPSYTNASGLTVLPFSVNTVAGSAVATAGGRAIVDHSGVGGTYRMNARL